MVADVTISLRSLRLCMTTKKYIDLFRQDTWKKVAYKSGLPFLRMPISTSVFNALS